MIMIKSFTPDFSNLTSIEIFQLLNDLREQNKRFEIVYRSHSVTFTEHATTQDIFNYITDLVKL